MRVNIFAYKKLPDLAMLYAYIQIVDIQVSSIPQWFVILFVICDRITGFVLRLNIWYLYGHYLQSYTLIFNQCGLYNFMVI